MRFRKGSKVEVFCGSEGPHGTWRGARIVEGNGHNYHVAYDWCVGVMKAPVTERVSRKLLRPCPPPLEGERDWVAGDVVEVFDGMSWKVGIVSKVTGEVSCLVKLLGTAKEIRVHKSDIRARQIWKEDKWVMAGSGPEACEDGRFDSRSLQKTRCKVTGKCGKRKLHEEDEFLFSGNNVDFKESRMVSSRNLKRGSPCGLDSRVACTRVGQKARALEKQGGCQRLVAEHASLLPEKVDAVASPYYMLGKKNMHTPLYNQIYEMDTARADLDGVNGSYPGRSLETSDTESSASSVGSCSINSDSRYRLSNCSLTKPSYDSDSHSSDAESFCGRVCEKNCSLPSEEDVAADIHKLELDAYRSTMGALFCSGPLSWEQEELVTNLRLMLHISNDEHLTLGQSWRLVHLASKGLKMVVKFTPTKCRQWNIICVQISTYEILMDIFCFITSLTPISRLAVVFKYLHVRCHHDLVKALLLVDACKNVRFYGGE